MTDSKPPSRKLTIVLPEGRIEVEGEDDFLAAVRVALGPVLAGPSPFNFTLQTPLSVPPSTDAGQPPRHDDWNTRRPNIRELYQEKRPTTDGQTAALIGYYLSEVAPPEEQQSTMDTATVVRYFKLCPRKLPPSPASILTNAKQSGYVDSVGRGAYKLTAIGYNLVVHGLPASPGGAVRERPVRKKRRQS